MIALSCDHAGYELKETVKAYLMETGRSVEDLGTFSAEEKQDYPMAAIAPCKGVVAGQYEYAILFCGTGIGISMAANKIAGIRAACCSDYFSAKFTRLHNNANVLCLGGRVVGPGLAVELAEVFVSTPFEGGRHADRVQLIMDIQDGKIGR